jgi:DNA-binding CsgD family transcriptional regulator
MAYAPSPTDDYLGPMVHTTAHYDYTIYHQLVQTFDDQGFDAIDPAHPLIKQLEDHLRANRQYVHVMDLVKLQVVFRASTSRELFGLEPEDIHIGTFFSRTFPIDQKRHSLIRARTLQMVQDLFIQQEGQVVQSAIFRQPDANSAAINVLFQLYAFHSLAGPGRVMGLLVLTNVTGMTQHDPSLHYYLGNDLSFFRYPDEVLLQQGLLYSKREMEILRLIAQRLESDQIAERLFLSVNTVNTHRRNILRKAGKSSTHELVIELKEMGLL